MYHHDLTIIKDRPIRSRRAHLVIASLYQCMFHHSVYSLYDYKGVFQ